MRPLVSRCLLALIPLSLSCTDLVFREIADFSCPPPNPIVDMAVAPLKCPAAKGLAGDNLLCVDFSTVTQLSDPALTGWKFDANMPGCWQIANGMLQVQNFATFMGNCGLTLPPIDLKQADKAQYQKVTLALLHKVDMSDADQQTAQVFLDLDVPARIIHQTTSRPGVPTLTATTLTINKADLPAMLASVYKFFLKASSTGISGRPGWQIQSVAVNASL